MRRSYLRRFNMLKSLKELSLFSIFYMEIDMKNKSPKLSPKKIEIIGCVAFLSLLIIGMISIATSENVTSDFEKNLYTGIAIALTVLAFISIITTLIIKIKVQRKNKEESLMEKGVNKNTYGNNPYLKFSMIKGYRELRIFTIICLSLFFLGAHLGLLSILFIGNEVAFSILLILGLILGFLPLFIGSIILIMYFSNFKYLKRNTMNDTFDKVVRGEVLGCNSTSFFSLKSKKAKENEFTPSLEFSFAEGESIQEILRPFTLYDEYVEVKVTNEDETTTIYRLFAFFVFKSKDFKNIVSKNSKIEGRIIALNDGRKFFVATYD